MAQHLGARIFVTVESQSQKETALKDFGIPPDHIFDYTSLDFTHGVQRMTNGQGVDVVVTSLSGEVLRATWDCISPFGRFISLRSNEILDKNSMEMKKLLFNVTFSTVNPIVSINFKPHTKPKANAICSICYRKHLTRQLVSLKWFFNLRGWEV
jgi:NADPH:quinone reductase-like Zn-dependent oxidoreductase